MRNEFYRPMSPARIGMSNELGVAHDFGVILLYGRDGFLFGRGEPDLIVPAYRWHGAF